MTRLHADTCEAEADHPHDCAAATELARLRAFAEAVRDEFACIGRGKAECIGLDGDEGSGHVDDCWHCGAEQALERAR
jgi:hypothetical protein